MEPSCDTYVCIFFSFLAGMNLGGLFLFCDCVMFGDLGWEWHSIASLTRYFCIFFFSSPSFFIETCIYDDRTKKH